MKILKYLAGVLALVLIDQMHQEEHVVGKVVLLHRVYLKSVWHLVKEVYADATDEAGRLQVVLDSVQLISQLTKGIDNQT